MFLGKMLHLFLPIFMFLVAVEPAVLSNLSNIEEENNTQTVSDTGNTHILTEEIVISHLTEATPPEGSDLLCWETPIDQKCGGCTDDSQVNCFLKGALRYLVFALIILAAVIFPFFCYWLHKSYLRAGKTYSIELKRVFCKASFTKAPIPEKV